MGCPIKFNWCLQIPKPENWQTDGVYNFEKEGNRLYPIGIPIDFLLEASPTLGSGEASKTAIAKVKILEFTNTENKTTGKYVVLKIYSPEEIETLKKIEY